MKGERVWCNRNYSLAMMVVNDEKAVLVPLEDVYEVRPDISKVENSEEVLKTYSAQTFTCYGGIWIR